MLFTSLVRVLYLIWYEYERATLKVKAVLEHKQYFAGGFNVMADHVHFFVPTLCLPMKEVVVSYLHSYIILCVGQIFWDTMYKYTGCVLKLTHP